jgi:hypothetical protein
VGVCAEDIIRIDQVESTTGAVAARQEYGGLKLDQACRLKELERENGRLKHAIADARQAHPERGC